MSLSSDGLGLILVGTPRKWRLFGGLRPEPFVVNLEVIVSVSFQQVVSAMFGGVLLDFPSRADGFESVYSESFEPRLPNAGRRVAIHSMQ